jgi:PAS domain-containing protein
LTDFGGAPGKQAPVSASGALAVLHDLASSPSTAADALALLHELQVHQVEVDLQAEALSESRAELESALRRQLDLHDALPVGCFTIDHNLVVHDLNLTAAGMLGIGRAEGQGLPLGDVLTPECQRALRHAISNIAEGRTGATPLLHLMPKVGSVRRVHAYVSAEPAGPAFLLVLADAGDKPAGTGR